MPQADERHRSASLEALVQCFPDKAETIQRYGLPLDEVWISHGHVWGIVSLGYDEGHPQPLRRQYFFETRLQDWGLEPQTARWIIDRHGERHRWPLVPRPPEATGDQGGKGAHMSDDDRLRLESARLLHDLGDLQQLLHALLDERLTRKRLPDLGRTLDHVAALIQRTRALLPMVLLGLLLVGCSRVPVTPQGYQLIGTVWLDPDPLSQAMQGRGGHVL